MEIKAIICDLGGVAHISGRQGFRRDLAVHYGWDVNQINEVWAQTRGAHLIGEISEDQFWAAFLDQLETDRPYELLIPELKDRYKLFISRKPDFFEALDILKEAHKDDREPMKFYAASNKGKEVAEFLESHLDLKENFDGAVFSWEIKTLKPKKGLLHKGP